MGTLPREGGAKMGGSHEGVMGLYSEATKCIIYGRLTAFQWTPDSTATSSECLLMLPHPEGAEVLFTSTTQSKDNRYLRVHLNSHISANLRAGQPLGFGM